MKTKTLSLCFLLTLLVRAMPAAEEPIDFDQARQYHERQQRGEALTPAEEAYINRAKAEQHRQKAASNPASAASAADAGDFDREKAQTIQQRRRNGEELSAEDKAYLRRAKAAQRASAPVQPMWTEHLTPLTELGTAKYKGEDGGLYGGGKNEPPKIHLQAAMREAAKIQPVDAAGKPSKDGKIGLISVGMSNTTQEFSLFKPLADADVAKSPRVVIVDGAQGGRAAIHWVDPQSPVWKTVDERLKAAGLSAEQIQVAWLKQATANPARDGEFPQHAKVFQENLAKGLANLKERFPNLRLVYLSSRIYAGYARTPLSPEPYVYEEAFALRWLIQDQIAGKPELNYDATKGKVKSALLLWGPYLWADGETPRKADGLIYKREDLRDDDGTHPSDTGRRKVADQLLKFLKSDATAQSWFTVNSSKAGAP
jgi:hypothetical protein